MRTRLVSALRNGLHMTNLLAKPTIGVGLKLGTHDEPLQTLRKK